MITFINDKDYFYLIHGYKLNLLMTPIKEIITKFTNN